MFKWPTRNIQPNVHCRLNESGELFGLNHSIDPPALVCLQLPLGLCLLRRMAVTGLKTKEIEPAMGLWAEESLPKPIDNYALDSWMISPDCRGLVAVPRAPIDQARLQLERASAQLGALRVPELFPPADSRPTVIFWATPENLLACFWDRQILYEWHSFPPGPPTRAILEQVNVVCKTVPARVYRCGSETGIDEAWEKARSFWPHAEFITIDISDPTSEGHLQDTGFRFDSYIHESKNHPATGMEKMRLGFAVAGACLAGLFLFHADVGYRERQVEQLRHQVSLLKIKASRSEKLAARSGKTLRQVRELRTMTIERNGIMKILQTLAESLPPRVKIDNISIEHSGATALDGFAETEVDISTFMERLRRSSLLRDPSLSFSQKDNRQKGDQALLRFRMEVRWIHPLLTLPEVEQSGPKAPRPAKTAVKA